MTSQLNVDTIKGKTTEGSISIQGEGSATTNLQQGLAKVWSQYDQDLNTINDSLNLSSITDASTGNYTVTINNNMGNDNFSSSGMANRLYFICFEDTHGEKTSAAISSSTLKVFTPAYDAGVQDMKYTTLNIFGDLA